MARQAKVEETVPTTLPDNFDHWDGGEVLPATLPDDFDEFDDAPAPPVSSSGPRAVVAAPPPGKSAEMPARRVSVAPHVGTVPAPAQIAPPAPKQTKRGPTAAPQQTGTISLNLRGAPAAQAQPAEYVTTEELSTLVQDYHATLDEESDVEKQRKKSRMIRWVGAIVLVLAIVAAVFVLVLHKPAAQSEGVVVVRNPVVTSTPDPTPVKEKPSPAKPAQQP
jgi:hypothetical protein